MYRDYLIITSLLLVSASALCSPTSRLIPPQLWLHNSHTAYDLLKTSPSLYRLTHKKCRFMTQLLVLRGRNDSLVGPVPDTRGWPPKHFPILNELTSQIWSLWVTHGSYRGIEARSAADKLTRWTSRIFKTAAIKITRNISTHIAPLLQIKSNTTFCKTPASICISA